MKIKLVKKSGGFNDPLACQWIENEGEDNAKKITKLVGINEELDLPDDICYQILAKYKGMFQIVGQANVSDAVRGNEAAADAKDKQAQANKSATAADRQTKDGKAAK
jgi:hypothetical protein